MIGRITLAACLLAVAAPAAAQECCRGGGVNKERSTVFGRVTTPAVPKRSPDAGTMDQVRPPSGMWHHDHAHRRLADLSSSNPIRWRPRADPGQKQVPGDWDDAKRD